MVQVSAADLAAEQADSATGPVEVAEQALVGAGGSAATAEVESLGVNRLQVLEEVVAVYPRTGSDEHVSSMPLIKVSAELFFPRTTATAADRRARVTPFTSGESRATSGFVR